jgi:hypothetical protein
MRKVAHWLTPGGFVLVRGPLSNSLTARVKESLRRVVGLRKHLPGYPLDANMFNPRSLCSLMEAAGLEPREWPVLTRDFGMLLATKPVHGDTT